MTDIDPLDGQWPAGPPDHPLPVRNIGHRVESPPDRVIKFQLTVQNRWERPLTILRIWKRCRFNNVTVGTGEFAETYFSMDGFKALAPQEEDRVDLRIPLSREALERIEPGSCTAGLVAVAHGAVGSTAPASGLLGFSAAASRG